MSRLGSDSMSTQASADTVLRLPTPEDFPRAGSPVLRSRQSGEIVAPARAHLSVVSGALVDRRRYFSTLGYQPESPCSPPALAVPATASCCVTLFGAVPVYAAVAKRSYAGQGSIALLENLLPAGPARSWFWFCWDCRHRLRHHHDVVGRRRGAPCHCEPLPASFRRRLANAGDARLLVLLAIVFLKGFREAILLLTMLPFPTWC